MYRTRCPCLTLLTYSHTGLPACSSPTHTGMLACSNTEGVTSKQVRQMASRSPSPKPTNPACSTLDNCWQTVHLSAHAPKAVTGMPPHVATRDTATQQEGQRRCLQFLNLHQQLHCTGAAASTSAASEDPTTLGSTESSFQSTDSTLLGSCVKSAKM
jgi:hypothetical protein